MMKAFAFLPKALFYKDQYIKIGAESKFIQQALYNQQQVVLTLFWEEYKQSQPKFTITKGPRQWQDKENKKEILLTEKFQFFPLVELRMESV